MDAALLDRADLGARLCEAVYDWRLAGRDEWIVEGEYDAQGVQAYVLRLADGARWLVIPGTGYAAQGKPDERAGDWVRNLRSAFALPKLGESGRFWWAWGFLEAADLLDRWLGDRALDFAAGHSQGAAVLQVLAWSRLNLLEAHALATPKAAYSPSLPLCDRLHCWTAGDDWVCRHPYLARHAGIHHRLPDMARQHNPASYRMRLAEVRVDLEIGG